MSAEIRTWITSQNDESLTAGELKKFLDHVPDDAFLEDGSNSVIISIEAVWGIE